MARSRSKPVPIQDLGTYLRGRTVPEIDGHPAPWDRLLTELRDGGYLAAEADLKQLLEAGGDPVLSQSLPAEAVRRILAAAGHRRYELHNGYLWWWNGPRRPPMSAEDVYVRYGFPVIARVDRSRAHQAPAPGQFGRRILTWAALAGKVLLGIPLSVVFGVEVAAVGLAAVPRLVVRAGRAGRQAVRTDRRTRRGTPPWQAELARLAHELGADEGESHRTYTIGRSAKSDQSDIAILRLVAVRDGEREDVVTAVSHRILGMGYQQRSRFRFSPGTARYPGIQFTPIKAGDRVPGTPHFVQAGQVGLRFEIQIPAADEYAGGPVDATAATTTRVTTNRDLTAAAHKTLFAAIPGFAVLAWYAVQALAPVHGTARIPASIVAATLSFAFNVVVWWFMLFGLAWEEAPHDWEAPRSVTSSFLKRLLSLLAPMIMFNALAGLVVAAVIAIVG